jgi:hypothetical protein
VGLALRSPPGGLKPGGWLVAGLAAGLAAGTKLTVLPVVAGLAVAVVVLAEPGRRLRSWLWWAVPTVAAGGYWYVRALALTGSPVPALALPGLPHLHFTIIDSVRQSVLHYAGDGSVLRHVFGPTLRVVAGPAWRVVLVVAAAGAVAGVVLLLRRRGPMPARILGPLALLALVAYAATPTTAGGPQGHPLLLGTDVRYATPGLLLALLAGSAALAQARRWALLADLVLVVLLAIEALAHTTVPDATSTSRLLEVGVAVLALLVALPPTALWRLPRPLPALAAAAALLLIGVAGLPVARHVLSRRYLTGDHGVFAAYAWAQQLRGQRVSVVGSPEKYPFAGRDLSNRVRYAGRRDPGPVLNEAASCLELMATLAGQGAGWVVVAPRSAGMPVPAATGWLRSSSAARVVLASGTTTVFRLVNKPSPHSCGVAEA